MYKGITEINADTKVVVDFTNSKAYDYVLNLYNDVIESVGLGELVAICIIDKVRKGNAIIYLYDVKGDTFVVLDKERLEQYYSEYIEYMVLCIKRGTLVIKKYSCKQ